MNCPHCALPLDASHYRGVGVQRLKSCTSCSQKLGAHVFHPVGEFGSHDPERPDAPHSECDGCRAQLRQLHAQGFTAAEFPYVERLELIHVYETIWTVRCEPGTPPPPEP